MNATYLRARAELVSAVRRFFSERDYLEVSTPVRIPAPAPEAHIDAVSSEDWVLHTSPELCMKRLLAAGLPRIFQICPCFRARERGDRHLPEFTLLEWYTADHDYTDLMDQTEALVRTMAAAVDRHDHLEWQGTVVPLDAQWERLTVKEAFHRYASESAEQALAEGRFDERLAFEVEPHLGIGGPVFLHDYPAELGALARRKPWDPTVVERFELYIAGIELCNGFTELTDPVEQRKRFETEQASRHAAGRPVHPLPEKFLADLGQMPAAAGNALGMDRLVMLLTNAARIDEVVCFTPETL